jgi:PRTRC genetic system ThiF family protein
MNSFQEDKEGVHYMDEYFHNPPHKISVIVVGAGGTGSHLLTTLARMNAALINLDYPGFHVTVWDDDEVSESNIGRQNFATEDIGLNKAEVITTRINRFFGFDWDVIPKRYTPTIDNQSNIIISCVDNIATRRKIIGLISGTLDIQVKLYYQLSV